jgi:hypothetical protein
MTVYVKIFFIVALVGIPLAGHAQAPNDSESNGFFDLFKRNITIPFDVPELKSGGLPSPEETLEEYSPKLKEFNQEVQEETGINLSKFLSWIVKILQWIFEFIVSALKALANALKS